MLDPRTGFAAIPPERATGEIRRFPLYVVHDRPAEDEGDHRVFVRFRGRNRVYSSPAELARELIADQGRERRRHLAVDVAAGVVIGLLIVALVVAALL